LKNTILNKGRKMTEKIVTHTENKLAMLCQLLKEMKHINRDIEGKSLEAYKYESQRKIVETIINEGSLDNRIDKLKNMIKKHNMREEAKILLSKE
jgi:hypothetical protein